MWALLLPSLAFAQLTGDIDANALKNNNFPARVVEAAEDTEVIGVTAPNGDEEEDNEIQRIKKKSK